MMMTFDHLGLENVKYESFTMRMKNPFKVKQSLHKERAPEYGALFRLR